MIRSENLSNVFAAFVAAQAELPSITRSKTVKVSTRNGGTYNFKYAPLDTVIDTVKPIYAKHGLSVTQLLSVNGIETLVVHESGEFFGSTFPIDEYLYKRVKEVVDGKVVYDREPISPQEIGSLVTYLKRYAYGAINHLALDDDDDGNHATGNTAVETTPPKRAPKPPKEEVKAAKEDVKPRVPKPPKEDPAPAPEPEPEPDVEDEPPFEVDGELVFDEVYEAKLREKLLANNDVPSMMAELQSIMKEIKSTHGDKKKEEFRVKFQPLVVKLGNELANR